AREVCASERPPYASFARGQRAACFFAGDARVRGRSLRPQSESLADVEKPPTTGGPLLEARDVEVVYRSQFTRRGHHALRGVSLAVGRGETVGVVGESGCGKSTLARVVLGLIRPTSGTVLLDGADLSLLSGRELRRLRRRAQMVFQDPIDTLNPRRTAEQTLADSLRLLNLPTAQIDRGIDDALKRVGLTPALRKRRRHELSGGQAQRVGIARALAPNPELVV